MSKVYLRRLLPDTGLVLKRPHLYPEGEEGYEADKRRIHTIEGEKERLTPLSFYINEELQRSKIIFGDPPSPCAFWVLAKSPKPEPYFKPAPPYLYVDVDFAPEGLLKLGTDKPEIGELGIRLVEEALSKLQSVPGFPVDVVRKACEHFRSNDYTICWKFYETSLKSTKIKCRIDLETSGAGTKRIFSASYRGKTLINHEISRIDRPDFDSSSLKDDIILDGHTILVKPKLWRWEVEAREESPHSYYTDTKIDLSAYPEVLELMTTKGWV